jgi:flavin reductase (DIM6/NTAB) family NADH-FMN oxidoreductase RutF
MIDPIGPILGRLPSGVFILTARDGTDETGMLASWVMQAGFKPPMLTAAVQSGRYLSDWLTAGRPFVLNQIAAGQKALLRHFARGFAPGEPAFVGLEFERTAGGVPVLAGTVGYLECLPKGHIDSGDHRVFLAQIVDGRLSEDIEPMVHVRKSGTHY